MRLPLPYEDHIRCASCLDAGHSLTGCSQVQELRFLSYLERCPCCNILAHDRDDCRHRRNLPDEDVMEFLIYNRGKKLVICMENQWIDVFRRHADKSEWSRMSFRHTQQFSKEVISNGRHSICRNDLNCYGEFGQARRMYHGEKSSRDSRLLSWPNKCQETRCERDKTAAPRRRLGRRL